MNRMKCLSAKKRLMIGCSFVLLLAESSQAQPSNQSPSFLYSVGAYGYLQKMDAAMNTLTTARVPNLARDIRIAAADISPDGRRLFLAVSRKENPLVIVETADLSVVPDVNVPFPSPPEPWIRHVPFDIVAVTSEILYWSDECYTTASTGAYSTVLVNLREKTAKPVREWSFENKNAIQISPDRGRIATYHRGGVGIIRVSTGEVLKTVGREVIGERIIVSFNMDWSQNILQCCVVPWTTTGDSVEKLRIDMNSSQVITRESIESTGGLHFPDFSTGRRVLTSATTYVLDEDGDIQIFDNTECKLSKKLDSVVADVTPGSKLALYVAPRGNSIFVQKNAVKTLADGNAKGVSSLYAVDGESGQVVATIDYPDEIVAVLFGK